MRLINKDTFLYFSGRMLRRASFWKILPKRLREVIPGLKPNLGELNQSGIYEIYEKNIPIPSDRWLNGRAILEIGTGRTNGSCYILAARGAQRAVSFEPFRPLDEERDNLQLKQVAATYGIDEHLLRSKVSRVTCVDSLSDGDFDVILSLAVLEHVTDMARLAGDLWRLLKPEGVMFHAVDYRDHFFRYPYHHLLWSKKTWESFLDPGDLPRWRIGDHIRYFSEKGFTTQILKSSSIDSEFEKIQSRIHPEFTVRFGDQDLRTAYGSIWAQKPAM